MPGGWIKKILLVESGSFKAVGGALIDTYNMYLAFRKAGYDVDIFADLSRVSKSAKPVTMQQIYEKKYDFVLINSIRDVPIALVYRYRKGKGTKFLYVDRGNVLVNFRNAGNKKLLPKMLLRYAYSQLMKGLLDHYVAITAEQYAYAREFFRGRKTKLHYINIAPHKEYRKIRIKKNYRGALYVGRLDERQKKLNFLIHGIARVITNHPELAKKELLRIVGTGPDEKHYRELAKALQLDRNIKFLGFLREEKLVRAYNNAGFFVCTSEWESPGRVFLEAMACGLPVMINTSNNSLVTMDPDEKLISDGDNGVVYRHCNVDDFANRFYRLYTDKEFRDALASNAYSYVKKFNFDNVMKKYRRIVDFG